MPREHSMNEAAQARSSYVRSPVPDSPRQTRTHRDPSLYRRHLNSNPTPHKFVAPHKRIRVPRRDRCLRSGWHLRISAKSNRRARGYLCRERVGALPLTPASTLHIVQAALTSNLATLRESDSKRVAENAVLRDSSLAARELYLCLIEAHGNGRLGVAEVCENARWGLLVDKL